MKLGRRTFYQTDEPGGGTAVEEPQAQESSGEYFNPSEADILAAANAELRSIADKLRSGEIVTDEADQGPVPVQPTNTQMPERPAETAPPQADPPAPVARPGVPAFLSRFAQQAAPDQPEGAATAADAQSEIPRPAASADLGRDSVAEMMKTPQGVNRLIGLLYESGLEENVALARQLDAARQAPAQETGSGPATTTTEPDPLDIPPFNAEAVRAEIEQRVRAELEAEHTPAIMDYDEDGNPITLPTKFKPDVNPAHRRQLEREVARQLENAEAKHEAKRAMAQTEKWRREQERQAQEQRRQQIESAYEEDSRRLESIMTDGAPLRAGGVVFSSKELFFDAEGNPIPMARDSFRYIRKQIESDFFRMMEDPAHKPEYDIKPLQDRLLKSGAGSRDPRVLTKEMTRLAVETFIAQNMPQSGQTAAVPAPMNGTQNGVKPQPPRQSWPANMPGPVSNAAPQPPKQGATQSAEDMVAEIDRQLAQEYGGAPPTDVLEKRYSKMLRDLQTPR